MIVRQSGLFKRRTKKLKPKEKAALDAAVKKIMADPTAGNMKTGDLAGVQVFKYKNGPQQYLLAYEYHQTADTLDLLSYGTHENFYRDLKH